MKAKFLIISLMILSSSSIAISQTSDKNLNLPNYKNQIGIQFNPYLNINETIDALAYGIRYGFRVSKHLMSGAEISGSFHAFNNSYVPFSNYKIGMFARYSFFPEKRIQGFAEASPFFAHTFIRGTELYPGNIVENKIGLYVAPGLSLYTKNRKFSMDLYYKLYIHPDNFYYHENVISYKVNFHF
jgi:hypothetical protein